MIKELIHKQAQVLTFIEIFAYFHITKMVFNGLPNVKSHESHS
jgi:hypothetical protein